VREEFSSNFFPKPDFVGNETLFEKWSNSRKNINRKIQDFVL